MNLNLYGHASRWLMVDCGLTFNTPLNPQDDYAEFVKRHELVAADPSFIVERKDLLCGIIITHAHEDHVGAIPFLWQRFRQPIYTTKFTAEVLRRKLSEFDFGHLVEIIEIKPLDEFQIGPFNVKWLPITHSLPEPCGLVISTPVGKVFHTGDWKLDSKPVVGEGVNYDYFKHLASQDIDAMVCDSTNALKHGNSVSESACEAGLYHYINSAPKRVVVACFASNIARLITIARVAQKTQRRMAVFGRSLVNMIGIARRTGYWPEDCQLIDPRHVGYLPEEEVLIVATGSQGEPRAALNQLAKDTHRDISLTPQDTIIFSTIVIPGNEQQIAQLVKLFTQRQIQVVQAQDSVLPIHASGHPNEQELRSMYRWVQPKISIPVHGEAPHLQRHSAIAKDCGVKSTLVGVNGDLFQISAPVMIKRAVVDAKRIVIKRDNKS
ncbi:MAG: ribonuclease J [Glaciecola sp.]|jgi:ribonuclease J|nr:ribonuclease J [Glaciecola sp.]MDG1814862.1 ribonuclease J [Glaciecola sp.]MDG2100451.1 ribonuclease J [Glaciecola sp.]